MFFKDLSQWSKNKIRLYISIFGLLYVTLSTIVPVIIVGTKYELFTKSDFKITAVGLIVIIFVASFGMDAVKWGINKMSEEDRKSQNLKYSIELLVAMVFPALALWVLHLIQKNIDLAVSTLQMCLYSYMLGLMVKFMFLKSLFNEYDLFAEAQHLKRVEAKKSLV